MSGSASARAQALADTLRATAAELIALLERISPERWTQIRKPGEWSPGKDAEHAADAVGLHLWRVRDALGLRQPGPPVIERKRLTPLASQAEVISRLRESTEDAARLVERLSDTELDSPDRSSRTVADLVARPLISHLATHQGEIERKLRLRPPA